MALISVGGISSGQLTPQGKGALIISPGARSAAELTALARGNNLFGTPGLCSSLMTGLGQVVQLVKIALVEAITATRIRITFDRPMKKDAALLSRYNYQVTPQTPGAATIFVDSVEPENRLHPEFVDLIISEMTDAATYRGEVNPDGPVDPEGVPMDPGYNYDDYTGIGIAPTVSQVVAVSENRIDVVYSETMKDNADIRNPSKYSFDNGLSVIDVLEFDGQTVKLVTSNQVPGTLYTLTLNP